MTHLHDRQAGVPRFECHEFRERSTKFALLVPVVNENGRIARELARAREHGVHRMVDIVLCDGGSTDGSTEESALRTLGVNTLLVKRDRGRQGAQLRMGIWWALRRGYEGILTIDGNDKDSIEDVPRLMAKLEEGYAFVQGSRFLPGGRAVNTPLFRWFSVRFVHAPLTSLAAGQWFTDTTNGFRAYSAEYLRDPRVAPLREVFQNYELLAYLSVRATQLGYRACEVPVSRIYPKKGKTPTKISFFKGNFGLLATLVKNLFGFYRPGA